MAKLKVKKGLEANLPAVEDGSLLITTDSKKLYLDNGAERIQVGGDSGGAGTYLFHLKFTDSTESSVTNIDGDFSKLSTAVTNGMNVIARVHDYENMVNFADYYLSTGTGSSTSPASPYELNYYDGLKLHSIVVNDFTDSGLSYNTSSTGVRTIVFSKTSDTEYTCGTDVALIVEENAVVGKVPNEGNNGYTFFYKVRDSIDNNSATPSDTVATTFISCDGNTIKKLTTQYSDYGTWHYSEQSLSGGGADANIYTSTGIKTPSALTDGFPIMSSDGSTNYVKVSEGTVAVKGKSTGFFNDLTSELIATPDIASPTGDDYTVSSIKLTSRLCGGPAGTGYDDTSLVFRRDGPALGQSTLLATSTNRSTYFKLGDSAHSWDEGYFTTLYLDNSEVVDYIIGSYHSGNTHWVEWASGLMEQWMSISKGKVNSNEWAAWGSSGLYYYDITNTYWPKAFSATHSGTAVVPVTTITAFASDSILWVKAANPTATTLPKISLVGPANMTCYNVRVDVHAVGYWK